MKHYCKLVQPAASVFVDKMRRLRKAAIKEIWGPEVGPFEEDITHFLAKSNRGPVLRENLYLLEGGKASYLHMNTIFRDEMIM